MAPKIRHPWLARGLELGQDWLDEKVDPRAARSVHEGARRALGAFVPALTARALALVASGAEFRVELRHSSLEPGQFHLLRSDVDLAFVSRGPLDGESLARALGAHRTLARAIPWLGELEIYTAREWALRERLGAEYGTLFGLIRGLRKWRWQLEARAAAPTSYHRRKAERSIGRIRAKLGLPQNEAPELTLPGVLTARLSEHGIQPVAPALAAPVGARSRVVPGFLGWALVAGLAPLASGASPRSTARVSAGAGADSGVAPGELYLEPALAVALAAVLPDAGGLLSGCEARIARARESSREISAALAAIAANEVVLCRSHQRVYGPDSVASSWIPNLLALVGPELAAELKA